MPPRCPPDGHTWRHTRTLTTALAMPDGAPRQHIIRECTVCHVAEVWHGQIVPRVGLLRTGVERWELRSGDLYSVFWDPKEEG